MAAIVSCPEAFARLTFQPGDPLGRRSGAIAQLGERVVRNDEVGGSIPPGSTSLRRLRLLRLGEPCRGGGCRVVAQRAKAGDSASRRRHGGFADRHAFSMRKANYSAACAITVSLFRLSQSSRKCPSHARSTTS